MRNNLTIWSTISGVLLPTAANPLWKGVALCRRFAYKQPDSDNREYSFNPAFG
jgi:hypothetical protein